MDLYGITRGAVSAINPLTAATLTASTGYITGANGKQVETYAAPAQQMVQVQDLSTQEMRQLSGLNIQGNLQKVYMEGKWNGIVRPSGQGGDLLTFNGQNWLIVNVQEQWPDWTCVIVCLQEK